MGNVFFIKNSLGNKNLKKKFFNNKFGKEKKLKKQLKKKIVLNKLENFFGKNNTIWQKKLEKQIQIIIQKIKQNIKNGQFQFKHKCS